MTGIKFLVDGEWQARKHSLHGRRQWRKVHLAMSDIRVVERIPSSDGDSPVLPELLNQIPGGEGSGTVTGNGAHDTRRGHTAITRPPNRRIPDPRRPQQPLQRARNGRDRSRGLMLKGTATTMPRPCVAQQCPVGGGSGISTDPAP